MRTSPFVHQFFLFIYNHSDQSQYMPASLDELIKSDYDAYEKAEKEKKEAISVVTTETTGEDGSVTTTTTTTTTKVETVVVKKSVKKEDTPIKEVKDNEEVPATEVQTSPIEPEKTPLPVEQPPSGVTTPAAIDDANIADPSTDRLRGRISLGRIGRNDSYGDPPLPILRWRRAKLLFPRTAKIPCTQGYACIRIKMSLWSLWAA